MGAPHGVPLLDVRHFRTRGLSSGTTVLLVLFGVLGGVSLVLYPFFQIVLGWSGLLATLGLMPLALLMMVASGLAPTLAARIGVRAAMAPGSHAGQILVAANESSVSAWQQSMWVGAAVMGVLVVFILLRGPERTPATDATAEPVGPAAAGLLTASERED